MDLTKHFLHRNLHSAIAEGFCVGTLFRIMQEEFINEDYKGARIAAEDIVKSLKELERLQEQRNQYYEFVSLIERLNMKGEHLKRWGM